MSTERQKKAFALLPYKIEPEYRGTDIGKYSECWSRCEDNSARYMLSYVANIILAGNIVFHTAKNVFKK